jgi:hypothetical protein
MTFLSLISPISIQKKKKKIGNINLEIHQFTCDVIAGIDTLKNCGICTESCSAMLVKFITVVTLALVSVHSFVIGVGTLLGV